VHRRDLLIASIGVLGFSSLSGCTGRQLPGSNGTETQSTSTQTKAPSPTTLTETPVSFPETCEPLPAIEGLPTPPSELTQDTAETFVRDFESVYAVETNDEYGDVDSLQIQDVEIVGERYIVRLSFGAVPATPTPDADGETPTSHPVDAYTHQAVYRLTGERMLRELRSHSDDSLLSKTCWMMENS